MKRDISVHASQLATHRLCVSKPIPSFHTESRGFKKQLKQETPLTLAETFLAWK